MTHLYYLPSQHVYLGKFDIYTEEDIEYADRIEKEWRQTQQNYTFYQLLEIFPQAKGSIKRNLVAEIKQCKRDLREAYLLYNEYTHKIIPQTRTEDQWFLFHCRDLNVEKLKEGRERRIKRNCFYLSALKPIVPTPTSAKITPQDIEQAKTVPLDTFLKVNRSGFAQCPLGHQDKTPSLRVYKNTNKWWCYSCNSGTDTIDLIMKLNNCDFITAVKKLVNK